MVIEVLMVYCAILLQAKTDTQCNNCSQTRALVTKILRQTDYYGKHYGTSKLFYFEYRFLNLYIG